MSKLVIIGNGFDLYHGLKTSVHSFIETYKEKETTNFFIRYFHNKLLKDGFTWIDFEKEIARILINQDRIYDFLIRKDIVVAGASYRDALIVDYDNFVSPDELFFYRMLKFHNYEFFEVVGTKFLMINPNYKTKWHNMLQKEIKEDYDDFKYYFNDYINKIDNSIFEGDVSIRCKNDIIKILHSADEIISFNYTSTLNIYQPKSKELRNIAVQNVKNTKYVHNKVNEDIIIGIEELENHNTEYNSSFYKTINYITSSKVNEIASFNETNMVEVRYYDLEIYFIGHSFGISDHYLFQNLKEAINNDPKLVDSIKINFYVYNLDSKRSFIYNLKEFFGSTEVDKMNHNSQIIFSSY